MKVRLDVLFDVFPLNVIFFFETFVITKQQLMSQAHAHPSPGSNLIPVCSFYLLFKPIYFVFLPIVSTLNVLMPAAFVGVFSF